MCSFLRIAGLIILNGLTLNTIFLNIVGLVLNTIAAIVLLFPNLRKTRNVDDDYIVSMNKETGEYAQKKHLVEKRVSLVGLMLLTLGFALQLIAVLF